MAVKDLWQTIGVCSIAWFGASWRSVEAEDPDHDLIKIGELWEGRSEPKRWVPITRKRSAPQPYPPVSDSWAKRDTKIWAGIASFRDKRCGWTLSNMFSKAAHPERVFAGVVQQNLEEDVGCLETYCQLMGEKSGTGSCPYKENIRILEVDAGDAQGPCWGRHLQTYLLADEEFCMQTDSHMDFVDSWDTVMMAEWVATHNEYGVLSTYVQDLPNLGVNVGRKWEVGHLCEVLFPASQQPRNQQARGIHEMTEPKMTTTWGAGFSFSKCHAERRVPYDPYLDQIFDGEEFSKMLRLWTNGYDVYTPRRGMIFHDYDHSDSSKTSSWRKSRNKEKLAEANQRLWNLMEMPGSTEDGRKEMQGGPWGLGDRRSLDQFIDFTAVDLRTKSWIGKTGNRCGSGVEWVPYDLEDDEDSKNTSFTSWRAREGKEPISAGPRWQKVKEKLEASGVNVWWADAVRSWLPVRYLSPPEQRGPPEILPQLEGGVYSGSVIDGSPGKRGVSWMALMGVLTCVVIAVVGLMGQTRNSRRRNSSGRRRMRMKRAATAARRRQEVLDWTGDAFALDTLSPVGVKSFSWAASTARKDHAV